MAVDTSEKWVTTKEVGEHLGVNRATLIRWIAEKNFPGVKVGKTYRFRLSEVDSWVKSQGGMCDGKEK